VLDVNRFRNQIYSFSGIKIEEEVCEGQHYARLTVIFLEVAKVNFITAAKKRSLNSNCGLIALVNTFFFYILDNNVINIFLYFSKELSRTTAH
jgi:hypothetical protein